MDYDSDNPAIQADDQREPLQTLYQLALEITEPRDLRHVFDMALRHCLELTARNIAPPPFWGRENYPIV
jgi:hypothetical protein